MALDKVKVLFIGGWGRSGSTLLGNILGEVAGFEHVGELVYIWELGILGNKRCGCGVPFRECAWWSAVLLQAYGGVDEALARRMFALRRRLPKHRHLPLVLGPSPGLDRFRQRHSEFLQSLAALYAGIQSTHGPRVIVDSSKAPFYALALAALPNVELRILHLIRDPRATAHAWSKTMVRGDGVSGRPERMQTFSPADNALKWATWNLGLTALSRRFGIPSMRVRYEDFVAGPRAVLDEVLERWGTPEARNPFESERRVVLHEHHTVWGNPSRMRQGEVQIRADRGWKAGIGWGEHLYLSALVWPLLSAYGYPLSARKS